MKVKTPTRFSIGRFITLLLFVTSVYFQSNNLFAGDDEIWLLQRCQNEENIYRLLTNDCSFLANTLKLAGINDRNDRRHIINQTTRVLGIFIVVALMIFVYKMTNLIIAKHFGSKAIRPGFWPLAVSIAYACWGFYLGLFPACLYATFIANENDRIWIAPFTALIIGIPALAIIMINKFIKSRKNDTPDVGYPLSFKIGFWAILLYVVGATSMGFRISSGHW